MIFPRNNPNSIRLFPVKDVISPGVTAERKPNPELQKAVETEKANRIITRSAVLTMDLRRELCR